MKSSLVFFAVLVFAGFVVGPVLAQTETRPVKQLIILEKDEELRNLYLNLNVKYLNYLSSNMWTLTHAYESKEEVDTVMKYLIDFFAAVNSNNVEKVKEFGGAKGFKNKFAEFMNSNDDAVKGFSAIVLGMSEDREYAPKILKLVNERDASFTEEFSDKTPFYRGRACVALGLLGAIEYKSDIAKLLRSKNNYDSSGAILALGELNAIEYTKEIVSLLTSKQLRLGDSDSPIHFLIDTNQAQNYKKELVSTMLGSLRSETAESAAYALAAIDAKETSKDVAKLLTKEFRKGTAAKVLALLGAKQYAPQIARLLNDKNSLVRADAMTSLGILEAIEYAPRIFKLITAEEKDFGSVYAAEAILLMGAKSYFSKARRKIGFKIDNRPYPMGGEFHPFVAAKIEMIRKRLEKIIDSTTIPKTD